MPDEEVSERLAKLETIVHTVSSDISDIKTALKDIASALKTLAVLEEKHNSIVEAVRRAFKAIEKNDDDYKARFKKSEDRFDVIERALPNLVLASSWVFKAVVFAMILLGGGAIGIVLERMFS